MLYWFVHSSTGFCLGVQLVSKWLSSVAIFIEWFKDKWIFCNDKYRLFVFGDKWIVFNDKYLLFAFKDKGIVLNDKY